MWVVSLTNVAIDYTSFSSAFATMEFNLSFIRTVFATNVSSHRQKFQHKFRF